MSTTKDKSQGPPPNSAMSEMDDKVSRYFDNQRKSEELERHHRKIKADSITTYNACGKLPSELLADCDELVKALHRIKDKANHGIPAYATEETQAGSYLATYLNEVHSIATEILSRYPNP